MGKIIFLHPDLGIGGAERLVVDAALAFKMNYHDVSIYTNHHDPNHCFTETKDGSFPVTVVGDWIPRSIFGRFKAACAYVRMIYAALYLAFFVLPSEDYCIVFCDSIAACIPFLKMSRGRFRIIYYCHHPDKLLSSEGGILKKIYRRPLDWFEEKSTGQADAVLVNSKYTARVYKDAFKTLKKIPDVFYPSVHTDFFEKVVPKPLDEIVALGKDEFVFLSINRYERKKNLELALEAMALLKGHLNQSDWGKVHLILAGGYDPINLENKEYYTDLKCLAKKLDIDEKVTFLKSPTDVDKVSLLHNCNAVVYTPSNEHFGIVPLEAMFFQKPVIAVNNGGPTETVVNDLTGYLRDPDAQDFAIAMADLVQFPEKGLSFGEAGRKRFENMFSFDAFGSHLDAILSRETYKLIGPDMNGMYDFNDDDNMNG